MKKVIAIILVIVLIAGGVILLKKRKDSIAETPGAIRPALTVQTTTAVNRTVQDTRTFLARLESRESASLSSKLSGRITEVAVSESQQVRKGDQLMKIDDEEIRATIESQRVTLVSLQNELDFSRTQHERDQALFEAGGLAREKLEASQLVLDGKNALLQSAKLKIKALEAQRSYLTITAPFDGTVGTLYLRKGDFASVGRDLVSINSPEQKLTFSYVPLENKPVKIGQDVLLDDEKIGKIHSLYDDAVNGLAVAEVALVAPLALPNGSNLTIDVVTLVETGCSLPHNAFLHRKDGVAVMAYDGERFEAVSVVIIAQSRDYALIDPCLSAPVALAAETKLSLLPSLANIRISTGNAHE